MPAAVCGAAPAASANKTLMQIITDLSLTTNLKLCLDAGDSNSYNPGVQTAKWLDTSGNGYDFYRGTSTGGDGAEPTFNGSAGGLSGSEYWSFDGGDYFTYDTTNEAWMNNLHKDGAVWSYFGVMYFASATDSRFFGTKPTGAFCGVTFLITSNGRVNYTVFNDAGGVASSGITIGDTCTPPLWVVGGAALDETAATFINKLNAGTVASATKSYASPSTNDVASTICIGAGGGANNPVPNGSRIACLAIWEGTALTSTNLTDLYDAIKGRFGL